MTRSEFIRSLVQHGATLEEAQAAAEKLGLAPDPDMGYSGFSATGAHHNQEVHDDRSSAR